MDKNAIKKFAVWARNELIERVSKKAMVYGISENEVIDPNADSVNGIVLTAAQKKERQALIELVFAKGYQQVMEEVAYTWFNRFCALRFMEVNNYLPSLVRVFTNNKNEFRPQILTEAFELDIEGLDKAKIYELKEANADEELYKYLLITQCNALNKELPKMFQKIEDYTELLFPDNLLREGSVVEQMIKLIPEDDWKDAVQIIGWLYQYYNIEPKNAVFANLKKNIKISKKDIPAATQLFTPDWIVRYMVENSLGRMWVEGHPDDELKAGWKYYLEEAQQEPEVEQELVKIREQYASLQVSDIKCIDPCMGSGHILAYMFDVLMEIYKKEGYRNRDAVKNIINCNLYGLDIDERAAQLAYFAVMMKGRQYDDRFLERNYQPHVHAIVESNGIDRELLTYFGVEMDEFSRENANNQLNGLLDAMQDACEYGSIINVPEYDFDLLKEYVAEYDPERNLFASNDLGPLQERLQELIAVGEILARKYEVVVTNPPYMGVGGMGPKLATYVKNRFPKSKVDLFAVFIEVCHAMNTINGYQAMITQHSWMFLTSFEKLRAKIQSINMVNMAHLGARAFEEIGGEVVQTTSFVWQNSYIKGFKGEYSRLVDANSQQEKENLFLAKTSIFEAKQDDFSIIPGVPIAYWVSRDFISNFAEQQLGQRYLPKFGMSTGDGERFIRAWYEIGLDSFDFCSGSVEEAEFINKSWVALDKGGPFRKWYGNRTNVVWWKNNGIDIKNCKGSAVRSPYLFFRPHISWTLICSANFSARYFANGFALDTASNCIYFKDNHNLSVLGLLNSKVAKSYLQILNPTLNFSCGVVGLIPLHELKDIFVEKYVNKNVEISKNDWDAFETSWDFQKHPLMNHSVSHAFDSNEDKDANKPKHWLLKNDYEFYKERANGQFDRLKANEEELNRIFIDIYGLQDELTPDVEDKDVTVHRIYDSKEDVPESMKGSSYVLTKQDVVKSLISYAVGCMFGRYSDQPHVK
ncbi:MAG: BREX-1 system adenine-specific DNA-methyltransferase PglX [Phascolarctobacterium sp.]|nr:BREX-1 system adenine-specific DNA-methyltransferase PglX [Phascolarctobacterium sp.]